MTLFDLVGFVGIALNLTGYFFIQHGTLSPTEGRYALIQCSSCCLLITSLWGSFNLPAFVLNSIVIAMTIYGYLRARKIT